MATVLLLRSIECPSIVSSFKAHHIYIDTQKSIKQQKKTHWSLGSLANTSSIHHLLQQRRRTTLVHKETSLLYFHSIFQRMLPLRRSFLFAALHFSPCCFDYIIDGIAELAILFSFFLRCFIPKGVYKRAWLKVCIGLLHRSHTNISVLWILMEFLRIWAPAVFDDSVL